MCFSCKHHSAFSYYRCASVDSGQMDQVISCLVAVTHRSTGILVSGVLITFIYNGFTGLTVF